MTKGKFSVLGFLATMPDMMDGSHRKDVFQTELPDNTVIDTCQPPDTGEWETGIQQKGKSWVIVEQYNNREESEKGHKKWISKLKKSPDMKLESCFELVAW